MRLNTFFNFGGNSTAFRFYEQHLGGSIPMLMRRSEHPDRRVTWPGWEQSVQYAIMDLGGTQLMGSDVPPDGSQPMRSVYLSLTVDRAPRGGARLEVALRRRAGTHGHGGDILRASALRQLRDRFGDARRLVVPSLEGHCRGGPARAESAGPVGRPHGRRDAAADRQYRDGLRAVRDRSKRDGPVVIEAPPGLLGGISDLWQREILGSVQLERTRARAASSCCFLRIMMYGARGYLAAKSDPAPCSACAASSRRRKAVTLITTRIYPLESRTSRATSSMDRGRSGTIFWTRAVLRRPGRLIEREPHDTLPSHERFQLAAIGIEKGRNHSDPDAKARRASYSDGAARCSCRVRARQLLRVRTIRRRTRLSRSQLGTGTWRGVERDSVGPSSRTASSNADRRAAMSRIHGARQCRRRMVEKHVGVRARRICGRTRDAERRRSSMARRATRLRVPAKVPSEQLLVGRWRTTR